MPWSAPEWASIWGSVKLKQSMKKENGHLEDAETGTQGTEYGRSRMIILTYFTIFLGIDFSASIRK